MLKNYKKQVLGVVFVVLGLMARNVGAMEKLVPLESKKGGIKRILEKSELIACDLPKGLLSPREDEQQIALIEPTSYASVINLLDTSEVKIEEFENPVGAEELVIAIITGNVKKLGSINFQMAADLYQVKNQEKPFDDFANLYLDILDLNMAKVNWENATQLAQIFDDEALSHLLYDWGVKKYRMMQEKQLEKTPQYDTKLLKTLCTTIATTLPDYARFVILTTLDQLKQITILGSAGNDTDNKLTIEKIVEHYNDDDTTGKQRSNLSATYSAILERKYKDLPRLTEKEEQTYVALHQKSDTIYANSILGLQNNKKDGSEEPILKNLRREE